MNAGQANAAADRVRSDEEDIAALAKGGRTNIFGFLLRLAARLPFLFIAGRLYGAEVLGRFAYAILVVEFAAQLATLGLKRGLAGELSRTERPHGHVVTEAILVTVLASLAAAGLLILFPQAMFPNSGINGLDRLLPLIIIAVAGSDIALAACAYRFDIAATVRARSIIEPWAISIGAFGFYFYSVRATTCHSLPPMPWNGDRAGSIWRFWVCLPRRMSSESIMWRNRSRLCRKS